MQTRREGTPRRGRSRKLVYRSCHQEYLSQIHVAIIPRRAVGGQANSNTLFATFFCLNRKAGRGGGAATPGQAPRDAADAIRSVSFRKRSPLPRGAKHSARQRSWQHFQQLGDLLRIAGGVGCDATTEAVDGRAKAVQLRDKSSRLIATPNCNSHVEADNGNHTFSPPRQICRAPFTARAKSQAANHHLRGVAVPACLNSVVRPAFKVVKCDSSTCQSSGRAKDSQ